MNRKTSTLMSLGISVALIAGAIWFLYDQHRSFGYGGWYMPHQTMMGGGHGGGYMGIFMILFWVVVIAAIALVVSGAISGRSSSPSERPPVLPNALEVLKRRYASGEITWGELEDKDKFNRLLPGRKRLMDTVRMIAYRSETAMATMLLGPTVDMADARRLLQGLFVTDADLLPDMENNRLLVRIHNASTPADNRSIASLLEELNKAEINFPGSNMQLTYELVNSDV
ncbi:SHOCT domain-containing protein [Desulfosarcina ovata]|uniref:SHOCT domain-containing protein n=1 Tax=Desulfosarcina ovata subsp. ovata TaxID=2752305 RepID=A0A5K8ACE5_9BACT|nr:hypothetical protein [Desulfosarcina ovata]BBO90297.1 hypothetical protein DSCOOX_34770 [Desulfosarcina ovata subsp. ovata]